MKGIADYLFVERLGDGNHGTFWLAAPPARLGLDGTEFVAVKTLAQQATDEDFKRMASELRVYATVQSDHLAPVFDAGHQDGSLFYVTSYSPGGSLGSPSRPMEKSEVVAAVADAADAADALHEAGIAHRNIKPDNVMIADRGRGAVAAKLGDLGLGQVISPGQTVTGIGPVGTIEYLAPELVRGQKASRASDIWALGVTLHRALTGRGVYDALPLDSLLEALRHIIATEPVLDPDLPASVASVVRSCLAVDPTARYGTASDLARALRGTELA